MIDNVWSSVQRHADFEIVETEFIYNDRNVYRV